MPETLKPYLQIGGFGMTKPNAMFPDDDDRPGVPGIKVGECPNTTEHKQTLVEFLRESPLSGVDIKFERSRDTGRKIDLSS